MPVTQRSLVHAVPDPGKEDKQTDIVTSDTRAPRLLASGPVQWKLVAILAILAILAVPLTGGEGGGGGI